MEYIDQKIIVTCIGFYWIMNSLANFRAQEEAHEAKMKF